MVDESADPHVASRYPLSNQKWVGDWSDTTTDDAYRAQAEINDIVKGRAPLSFTGRLEGCSPAEVLFFPSDFLTQCVISVQTF